MGKNKKRAEFEEEKPIIDENVENKEDVVENEPIVLDIEPVVVTEENEEVTVEPIAKFEQVNEEINVETLPQEEQVEEISFDTLSKDQLRFFKRTGIMPK